MVEAFAAGLPVVTSDIPTIREVAGDAAVLVDPKDLNEIARGVKTALEKKQELINKGLERSKLFTRENFRDKIVKLYTVILNSS
ncbi:MAG: glycosyltransferase [Nitrososphaeria archaeon]